MEAAVSAATARCIALQAPLCAYRRCSFVWCEHGCEGMSITCVGMLAGALRCNHASLRYHPASACHALMQCRNCKPPCCILTKIIRASSVKSGLYYCFLSGVTLLPLTAYHVRQPALAVHIVFLIARTSAPLTKMNTSRLVRYLEAVSDEKSSIVSIWGSEHFF